MRKSDGKRRRRPKQKNFLSASALKAIFRKEPGWDLLVPFTAGAQLSSLSIPAVIGDLNDVTDVHKAVHEAINDMGLLVADFGEADAYAVSLLAGEADAPVDLADLASIALALRLDGQAVFIGKEKARLKRLAPENLVFV